MHSYRFVLVVIAAHVFVISASTDNLNRCLQGKHHKSTPGKEGVEFKKYHICLPWSSRSCCTANTSRSIHEDGTVSLYNMQWDHCERNLSSACREWFLKDTCFYECSPNIGPWIVLDKKSKKVRRERFLNVPLCASDCESWFEACKEDLTCSDNWNNWIWTKKGNLCKKECKTFKEYFHDSRNFCANIFDKSFEYKAGTPGVNCLSLWPNWTKNGENPNAQVARRVQTILDQASKPKDPKIVRVLDRCLTSKNHKTKPGPEGDDYKHECIPWRAHSCCTSNTTKSIKKNGGISLYNMKWDHCGNLSKACRDYFMKDTCFYECSPNLAPWIVKDHVSKYTRRERLLNVPLCSNDCDGWFEACKDDKTCSDNWGENWKWVSKSNECNLECKRFKDYFKDSVTFCNKIFNYSFVYTEGKLGQDCMTLWPDSNVKDPNREVAYLAAKKLLTSYTGRLVVPVFLQFTMIFILIFKNSSL